MNAELLADAHPEIQLEVARLKELQGALERGLELAVKDFLANRPPLDGNEDLLDWTDYYVGRGYLVFHDELPAGGGVTTSLLGTVVAFSAGALGAAVLLTVRNRYRRVYHLSKDSDVADLPPHLALEITLARRRQTHSWHLEALVRYLNARVEAGKLSGFGDFGYLTLAAAEQELERTPPPSIADEEHLRRRHLENTEQMARES